MMYWVYCPLDPDSDDDGDSDGDEVAYGSDPKLDYDTLDDHRPVQPELYAHAGDVPLTNLRITASPFSDPDVADTLGADQWQIAVDSGFSQLLLNRVRTGNEALDDGATLPVPDGLLGPGDYGFWTRLRHSDNLGLWSDWSYAVEYTTPVLDQNDQDGDGRSDLDQFDSYSDLDADGEDDTGQAMARITTLDQGRLVGFTVTNAPLGTWFTTLAPLSPLDVPEAVRSGPLPYGLFSYSIALPDGWPVNPDNAELFTLNLYFDEPIPAGTTWVRYDPVTETTWDISDEVTFNGNHASLTVTDGELEDLDGLVNGLFVDPLGPVFPDMDTDSDGVFDSQDNCTEQKNADQWDTWIYNLLLLYEIKDIQAIIGHSRQVQPVDREKNG